MNPADRITRVFTARRAAGQLAFMPFITAGDPNLATTQQLIRDLATQADLIEVGFPYSDPIADGPVIQASYSRALGRHVRLSEIFAAVQAVSGEVTTPLVAMVAYAIVYRHGPERFVKRAAEAGFAGLIVPDLPGDEAGDFAEIARRMGLALVQLVAPTTPPERLKSILAHASGFVYCIAVAGTTGVRDALPLELGQMLQQLRQATTLPLAVGFGIGRPEQIHALKGLADGVIVGSALVRHLDGANSQVGLRNIAELASSLASAAHS